MGWTQGKIRNSQTIFMVRIRSDLNFLSVYDDELSTKGLQIAGSKKRCLHLTLHLNV